MQWKLPLENILRMKCLTLVEMNRLRSTLVVSSVKPRLIQTGYVDMAPIQQVVVGPQVLSRSVKERRKFSIVVFDVLGRVALLRSILIKAILTGVLFVLVPQDDDLFLFIEPDPVLFQSSLSKHFLKPV